MDKILESIIKNLIQSTIDGEIGWQLAYSIFNSDTCKKFEAKSLDGLTKFTIEVNTDSKFIHKPKDTNLVIFNSSLVDGSKYLDINKNPLIKDLSVIIFNKYIAPSIPNKNDENTLENILDSLSNKQQIRDEKIDSILNEKDKGFLNRILRK